MRWRQLRSFFLSLLALGPFRRLGPSLGGERFLVAEAAGFVELVTEKPARFDQEVARAHRWVEHLQFEDLERVRIILRAALFRLGAQGFLHEEPHEGMGRVVRAAGLASETHAQVEAAGRDGLDPLDFCLLSCGWARRVRRCPRDGFIAFGIVGIEAIARWTGPASSAAIPRCARAGMRSAAIRSLAFGLV